MIIFHIVFVIGNIIIPVAFFAVILRPANGSKEATRCEACRKKQKWSSICLRFFCDRT